MNNNSHNLKSTSNKDCYLGILLREQKATFHKRKLILFLQVEEEISTLKQVLTAKEHRASELRKILGITPLSQIKAELNKVQSSQA